MILEHARQNDRPFITPFPGRPFEEVTKKCPTTNRCSIMSIPYTLLKLNCAGADKKSQKAKQSAQCFTYVIEDKSEDSELLSLDAIRRVQLEDVVPGAVSTFKNADGYAKILMPLFIEEDTRVFCTCGYNPSHPEDLKNVTVVSVKFRQNISKTIGCSFQTDTDKELYRRFANRESHLTNKYILNDDNPVQLVAYYISDYDIVGLQCGPTVDDLEDELLQSEKNRNGFMTEPMRCFETVYGSSLLKDEPAYVKADKKYLSTLIDLIPNAEAYPKYDQMTPLGHYRHTRYVKFGYVIYPKEVMCECRYYRNGKQVYTGRMFLISDPMQGFPRYLRSANISADDANHDKVVNLESTENDDIMTLKEDNNDNVNNDSINNDNINNDNINNDSINNESINNDNVNNDSINNDNVNNDSINNDNINNDSINNDSINNDNINNDSINNDSINNDNVNNDSINSDNINNDNINNDSINNDNVNNDSINNDNVNNDSINSDNINNDSINNTDVTANPIHDDVNCDKTCDDRTGDCENSNPNCNGTRYDNLSKDPNSTHTSYHSEHSKNEFVINDAQNVNIFLPQVNNYNINHGTISKKYNRSDNGNQAGNTTNVNRVPLKIMNSFSALIRSLLSLFQRLRNNNANFTVSTNPGNGGEVADQRTP